MIDGIVSASYVSAAAVVGSRMNKSPLGFRLLSWTGPVSPGSGCYSPHVLVEAEAPSEQNGRGAASPPGHSPAGACGSNTRYLLDNVIL